MNKEKIVTFLKSMKDKLGLSPYCKKEGGKDGGFTLIELLIVIAIIGILAGIVIAVINPTRQRTKANEAVLRANVAKMCQAWAACLNASPTGNLAECNTAALAGINVPNPVVPVKAVYRYTNNRWQGVLGSCTIYCDRTSFKPTLSGTCAIVQ